LLPGAAVTTRSNYRCNASKPMMAPRLFLEPSTNEVLDAQTSGHNGKEPNPMNILTTSTSRNRYRPNDRGQDTASILNC
jgi:hypothetical protein